ncbi:hypothetical protein C8R45DRAFT_944386 [Mycena sanguinolenta]|nr:hypothetical protein C8R45DRAFT_944386 [Mycena sanguinolenta]
MAFVVEHTLSLIAMSEPNVPRFSSLRRSEKRTTSQRTELDTTLAWESQFSGITAHGHEVPATQPIDILENFPSLTDLACLLDLEGFRPPDHEPLTFPNLRALKISSYKYPSYNPMDNVEISVLEPLTLPQLSCFHCTTSPDADLIAKFMSRSACAIRDLKCEFHRHDPAEVWDALALFPFVERLEIALPVDISLLLKGLDSGDTPPLRMLRLPQLQHLKITHSGSAMDEGPVNYNAIIDVLRRRREHTATAELTALHLMVNETKEWGWYPGETLAAEFRRLIANGLDFTMGVQGRVVWPTA